MVPRKSYRETHDGVRRGRQSSTQVSSPSPSPTSRLSWGTWRCWSTWLPIWNMSLLWPATPTSPKRRRGAKTQPPSTSWSSSWQKLRWRSWQGTLRCGPAKGLGLVYVCSLIVWFLFSAGPRTSGSWWSIGTSGGALPWWCPLGGRQGHWRSAKFFTRRFTILPLPSSTGQSGSGEAAPVGGASCHGDTQRLQGQGGDERHFCDCGGAAARKPSAAVAGIWSWWLCLAVVCLWRMEAMPCAGLHAPHHKTWTQADSEGAERLKTLFPGFWEVTQMSRFNRIIQRSLGCGLQKVWRILNKKFMQAAPDWQIARQSVDQQLLHSAEMSDKVCLAGLRNTLNPCKPTCTGGSDSFRSAAGKTL